MIMRNSTKKRLQFFIVAIIIFASGFQWLPEQLALNGDWIKLSPLLLAGFGYFVFLPVLYWFWVIKAGQQKPWKMLLIISLSCLCARYSFPNNVAEYFDFITYVRYPIIAILLIIELYLMVTIIRGLWQARKLSGDPRVHTFEKYKDDEKKLTAALPLSWEPASWYYAIPRFSRNHAKAIAQLKLKSANKLHWLALMAFCIVGSIGCYLVIVQWSEIAAIIVSSLFFYSVIFLTANYRVARRFSIYKTEDKLVINSAFLSFIIIDLAHIEAINIGEFNRHENKEQLTLGQGEIANVELVFNTPQTYLAMMGSFPEQVERLWLNVEEASELESLLATRQLAKAC